MRGCIHPMSSPMMKRMFGFCGVCATAGVVAGPHSDSDTSVVAPRSAAQDRLCQPVETLRGRFEMSDGLSWFVQQIMTSPSLFVGGKKAPRQMHGKLSCLQNGVFTRPAWAPLGRLARPYNATSCSISGLWDNRQPLG